MGVVIQEFEVVPATAPPAAPPPTAADDSGSRKPAPDAVDVQRRENERRQRALRLFAH